MRRVTLMLAAMAVMVSLFAVVAYAADIHGTDIDDESTSLNGTTRSPATMVTTVLMPVITAH